MKRNIENGFAAVTHVTEWFSMVAAPTKLIYASHYFIFRQRNFAFEYLPTYSKNIKLGYYIRTMRLIIRSMPKRNARFAAFTHFQFYHIMYTLRVLRIAAAAHVNTETTGQCSHIDNIVYAVYYMFKHFNKYNHVGETIRAIRPALTHQKIHSHTPYT